MNERWQFTGTDVSDMHPNATFAQGVLENADNGVGRQRYTQVLEDIEAKIQECYPSDTNQDLPKRRLIKLFLYCLFENSVDATVGAQDPFIDIRIEETEKFLEIELKNNGKGFAGSEFLDNDSVNYVVEGGLRLTDKTNNDSQYGGRGKGLAWTRHFLTEKYNAEFWYGDNLEDPKKGYSIVGVKIPKPIVD